eukprot:scaffold17213_cov15-Tisochrysis_lutea.AAC.1
MPRTRSKVVTSNKTASEADTNYGSQATPAPAMSKGFSNDGCNCSKCMKKTGPLTDRGPLPGRPCPLGSLKQSHRASQSLSVLAHGPR